MNNIPKHWQVKKLSEIGKSVTGTTPPKNDTTNYGNNIPFVKPPQLFNSVITNAPEKLSTKGASLARILPENSVLITCIGNLGRTAINKVPVAFNQQINAVIPSKDIDGKFLFYQAQSHNFKSQLDELSSATTVAIVNKGKFETIRIVLPPLPEQLAIVSKIEELLSDLENGKQQLLTAQQQLKVYRQSLLKAAFEGRLTNKDVDEGELPEGWKLVLINQISEMNPKIPNKDSISKQMDVQFLPMKLVEAIRNKVHLTEVRKYEDVLKGSYTPFINGDVIFAKVTPCMENGKIAVVDYLKNGIGFGSSEFHVLRPGAKLNAQYLFYYLVQDRFRHEAASEMTGAVGLRRVPKQFIENHNIPLPQLVEQQQIVEILESKLTVCDKIEETISQSLQQAETLKQSILKKAFEGKLI